MAQTKAFLPPKAGYIEVEDANGNHAYQRIPREYDAPLEELDTLMVDHEYRLVLVELGLDEETEV